MDWVACSQSATVENQLPTGHRLNPSALSGSITNHVIFCLQICMAAICVLYASNSRYAHALAFDWLTVLKLNHSRRLAAFMAT
jgi:hypothetical protein